MHMLWFTNLSVQFIKYPTKSVPDSYSYPNVSILLLPSQNIASIPVRMVGGILISQYLPCSP